MGRMDNRTKAVKHAVTINGAPIRLTDAELIILREVAEGASDKDLQKMLDVSLPATARKRKCDLFQRIEKVVVIQVKYRNSHAMACWIVRNMEMVPDAAQAAHA